MPSHPWSRDCPLICGRGSRVSARLRGSHACCHVTDRSRDRLPSKVVRCTPGRHAVAHPFPLEHSFTPPSHDSPHPTRTPPRNVPPPVRNPLRTPSCPPPSRPFPPPLIQGSLVNKWNAARAEVAEEMEAEEADGRPRSLEEMEREKKQRLDEWKSGLTRCVSRSVCM